MIFLRAPPQFKLNLQLSAQSFYCKICHIGLIYSLGEHVYPRDGGSALSLGSVGTRRTVYLPEDDPTPPPVTTTSNNQNAPPLLVYNRISTVIGESPRRDSIPQAAQPSVAVEDNSSREPANNERKKENAKENAIWYEYGCV